MRIRSWLWSLAVGFLLIATVLAWNRLKPGIVVTITNSSGEELSDLRITFASGVKSVPKLKPAESFTFKINPAAESGLAVLFLDSAGSWHSNAIDVYVEHNYSGTIEITIDPTNKVRWKDNIRVGPL